MGRVYDIFDKFSIISIAIGLILGIVLAVHHNDSSLWIRSVPYILIFAFVITIAPVLATLMDNLRFGKGFPVSDLVEAFFLNVAIIAVCMAFGVVIGSFLTGNVILDNGKLPSLINVE